MSVDLNCKGFMLLQPVSLVTPGPLRTLSLKRTPLPHLGKRKHSSEQVIFTVHSSTVFIQIKKLNKMKKKKKKNQTPLFNFKTTDGSFKSLKAT